MARNRSILSPEYVVDNFNDDNDDYSYMDPNEQSFGESEQELGDEDISEELNNSDLSKSIQPSVPGSLFQDKMKAQADRAQEIMNKIKQARELVDSASAQEALRDCNLEGIRD